MSFAESSRVLTGGCGDLLRQGGELLVSEMHAGAGATPQPSTLAWEQGFSTFSCAFGGAGAVKPTARYPLFFSPSVPELPLWGFALGYGLVRIERGKDSTLATGFLPRTSSVLPAAIATLIQANYPRGMPIFALLSPHRTKVPAPGASPFLPGLPDTHARVPNEDMPRRDARIPCVPSPPSGPVAPR